MDRGDAEIARSLGSTLYSPRRTATEPRVNSKYADSCRDNRQQYEVVKENINVSMYQSEKKKEWFENKEGLLMKQ